MDNINSFNAQKSKRLAELVDDIRLNVEVDFGQLSNVLEEWIAKIQSVVGNRKYSDAFLDTNHTDDNNTQKLLELRSNFFSLLGSLEQTKQSTLSITNSLAESLNEPSGDRAIVLEESKIFDSHNIQYNFITHDFEIGGIINGIINVPHHHFIITGHNTGYVNLWSKTTLQLVNQFKAHDAPITTMAYLEKEKLLFTGSLDGKVRVLESHKFPIFKHLMTADFERKKVFGILPLIEWNFLIVSCKEGYIYILNLKNLKLIKTLRRPGPFETNSVIYVEDLKAIVVACSGINQVEIISLKNFLTLERIQNNYMVWILKGLSYNPFQKELLISFAYKIIKAYSFKNGKAKEERSLSIDKPLPSKMDFIDEEHMVLSSLTDKLDFIRIKDGHPVKTLSLGFTFSDFLLLKEERKIIVFPYQSSEMSIAIVEY